MLLACPASEARLREKLLDKLKRNLQYYPTCTEMGHSCTEMGHSGRSAVSPHFVSPSKRCNGICAAVDFCGSRLILQVPLKHVPLTAFSPLPRRRDATC